MTPWQPEPITIHRTDGRLTVDAWPRQAMFGDYLLSVADPAFLKLYGDIITVIVSNGQAVYRVLEHDINRMCQIAQLESSRLQPVERKAP